MKTIILFVMISYLGFSQDYDTIKSLDTIFILYKGGKEEHQAISKKIFPNNIKKRYFVFGYKANYGNNQFMYPRVIESDSGTLFISDVIFANKSFVKNHKNKIIDITFFCTLNNCLKTKELFGKTKPIYIIDSTTKINGKHIVYPVTLLKYCQNIE